MINVEMTGGGNVFGSFLDKAKFANTSKPTLCVVQDAATQSQLTVGLCFLPIPAATNYYVLFYDEATGVALVVDPAT